MMSNDPGSLKVGNRTIVAIDDIAFGGEGVARLSSGEWGVESAGPPGFVIFVPFVLVGEKVEIEITEVKKRFARARLIRIVERSPDRVEPQCRYFGDCGGCQYQHIAYAAQLEVKRKQIADLFQRVGGLGEVRNGQCEVGSGGASRVASGVQSAAWGEVVRPVVPCPQAYGYRNRIMIRSQWDKFKQGLNIGFIRADNRLVVDVKECEIAEPALNVEIERVRKNPPPKGGIKVVLRVMPEGWEVPKDSFFQNNFFLLPELVKAVRERMVAGGMRYLIDSYCGVGFFSLETADLVERFVGMELDLPAVKAARANAASRQITNGEFLAGRTEELLPAVFSRFDREQTVLILDPPRMGCPPEFLDFLCETRVGQVIYVSCNPATLARDLNILCSKNVFELNNVLPLDMFPQTQHVECVADVRLRSFKTSTA